MSELWNINHLLILLLHKQDSWTHQSTETLTMADTDIEICVLLYQEHVRLVNSAYD